MKPRVLAVFLLLLMAVSAGLVASPARAQAMPAEYQEVLKFLGHPGDFQDNVLKVNIPRNDLQVTVQGYPIPTAFGFGGWVGMTKGAGELDVMMGDLVLLQEEVNPVMSALLENGLEVTALHNHFFWEEPRIFYMHIHGSGKPPELARKFKPVLDLIGKVAPPAGAKGDGSAPSASPLHTQVIAQIVGYTGAPSGPVYKITVGRRDFTMKEMGAVINARMGLNSWAAFIGTDQDTVVAGDMAMLESEVTPVLKALRSNGLEVVAIHQHMTGTRPVVIFLHYWGRGPAEKLAAGFRAALDQLGKR